MRIGIGLPTMTAGADPQAIVVWARRAEEAGFSSLGVVDRIAYDGHEPLTALAAAAAVTRTIRLVTMIVIGPTRQAGLLAKQIATLDSISGGRMVLGLAVGARKEDYDAVAAPWSGRGERLSEQIARLRDDWEDERIGPPVASPGPIVLVGGGSGASMLRVARYADGYVHGGGPPRAFASAAARARAAWIDAGRPGSPRLWGQSYFSLGDEEAGAAYMRDYYGFTGVFVERIVGGLLTTAGAIQDQVRGYEEAGCEELVLLPTTDDAAEIDRLAVALHR